VLDGAQTLGRIVDRDDEIARIVAAVDAGLRGEGRLVYVEGHAGIGKTRLVEVACAHGERRGARVLLARGGDLERDHSHGIVRQLFEQVALGTTPRERRALLGGPAALAERALGAVASPTAFPHPDSPFPIVHALWWLTANLAAREPLVIAIDDAHWADAPSLRFADYLAGRLDGLPVAVVVAARPSEPGAPAELLERLRTGRDPLLVAPAPLGERATAALLREHWRREPSAAFVAACHRSCGGNPLYVHALARELRDGGVAPDAEGAAVVQESGPDAIARALALRLTQLPEGSAAVLDAVAVFGLAAEVRHVAATTGIGVPEVGALADLLADAGLLAAGRPLRFAHPVVRQSVYARLRPAARTALHARAASVLAADDRPPEEIARHLLVLEPAGDPHVVATLRAVAADALAQGSADVALTHLRRALLEPPEPSARGELLAELGQAELLVGEPQPAGDHLERAAAATAGDPERRAVLLRAASRARLHRGDLAGAVELLEAARDGVGPETDLRLSAHAAAVGILRPPLAAAALERLEERAAAGGWLAPHTPGGGAAAEQSGRAARGERDTPAAQAALAELAAARWLDGRIVEGADLAERALAGGTLLAAEGAGSLVVNHALRVLVDADREAQALPVADQALEAARRQGSVLGVVSMLGLRALSAWRRGDVLGAEARARELLDLTPTTIGKLAHWSYLALALVERGELEEAETAVARSGADHAPLLSYTGVTLHARARLRLAQGRAEEALADLADLRERERQLGVGHLSVGWHRTAVEAALALGDATAARDLADEQLARSERWRTAAGRGVTLSTLGLATGGRSGLPLLAEGAELLGRSPARLDHARALVDLGAALRRAGRPAQAREPLRAGHDAARACGATVLAARAHEELAVAGAKPRRLEFSGAEALTAAERRVAELAAGGLPNREIAATLFVTVRTVENHLARAYRKLGIASRRALAAELAGG
jgi:DNA-binding CsgD family transcriptional regulator